MTAPRRRGAAWWRLPLLALGFVALAVGTGAGLARLAWPVPGAMAAQAALHGPLMVCGFFGVVISIERAVAIGRVWAWGAPLAAAAGSAALMHGGGAATPWLYTAACVGLLAASLHVLARQRTAFNAVIALGAFAWAAGTALWALGDPVHRIVGWWVAFLVLTIAGERLELSRFLPTSRAAQQVFAAIVALLLAGAAASASPAGQRLFGVALLALAAWLARHDIARRTVRQSGLTRYIALSLLGGYVWLAIGGAVIAAFGLVPGSAAYDAALHALLLGFVFAMVFGHAPIIFPAVLRVTMRWGPFFYAPLALLHAAMLLRIAGDAGGDFVLRRWGGMLAAAALLGFVCCVVASVVRGRRR